MLPLSRSAAPDELTDLSKKLLNEAAKLLIEHLPALRKTAHEIIELVFVPRAIFRQLVLAVALETGALTAEQLNKALRAVSANFSSRARLIRQLRLDQSMAQTQDEWMDLAERIDNIQGDDVWRSELECPLYEANRISPRIDEFVHLMRRRDIFDLMFTLRGGIARNKFGLLHEGLFSKALAGSKILIETYHNVVCAALDFICDAPVMPGDDPIPTEARLAFFNEMRHSYGRTALLLSGGAALGFYHVGVVKVLMQNGLLPRVISGASAGSILVGMIGTRTDEECMRDLFELKGTTSPGHSGELKLDFFRPLGSAKDIKILPKQGDIGEVIHNPAGGFMDAKKTWQLLIPIGLRPFTSFLFDVFTGNRRPRDLLKNDTEHFRGCCRTSIGNFTFQEAFDRSGRIMNIVVSPTNRSDPPRLLNYLTAPHVLVWSAAVASSSLPGVFEPNQLLVRDADGTERFESAAPTRFVDGSMEQDLPMTMLSELFNVNHFIISQANPHAVMLASFNLNRSVWTNRLVGLVHGTLLFLKNQVKSWIRNVVELIGGRRIAPMWDTRRGIGSQLFTQEYQGRETDISLIPWKHHRSLTSALLHLLFNPSDEEFSEWILAAERETWRYIPKIKSHVAEEMTLDRCVQRLRKRLMLEVREARQTSTSQTFETAGEKMGSRLPSFFTSPSLLNLGGLAVGDPYNMQNVSRDLTSEEREFSAAAFPSPQIELKPGWCGMGLQGNHSFANLASHGSVGSGLFMESDDERSGVGDQTAGELTNNSPVKTRRASFTDDINEDGKYFKTTTMANFYYRKSKSHDNLSSRSPACEKQILAADSTGGYVDSLQRRAHSETNM